MWMAKVVVRGDSAFATAGDDLRHPGDVAVEPVHVLALDAQPRAAVHPGTPFARAGDRRWPLLIVELRGEPLQRFEVHPPRWVVVDREVDVSVGTRGSPCVCPPEGNSRHARDFPQPRGNPPGKQNGVSRFTYCCGRCHGAPHGGNRRE